MFAVGGPDYYGGTATVVRYSGAGNAWTTSLSGRFARLNDVWGSSATDVYAVGEKGTLIHYDGKSWSAVNAGTTDQLVDIWGFGPEDIFVVGFNGTILRYSCGP